MAKRKPYDKAHGRDYQYDTQYESTPEQKKRRAGRNKARAIMEKKGKVHKGDMKDVDHRSFDARDDSLSNIHVMPQSANRAKKPLRLRRKK